MAPITKTLIAAHRQCPQQAWRMVHTPELSQGSAADELRIEQGKRVGNLARTAFPGARLIPTNQGITLAALATNSASEPVLFEAAILAQVPNSTVQIGVRADVLDRSTRTLVEVKSAGHLQQHHVEDAAIQTAALVWAGQAPATVQIMHPDSSKILAEDSDAARLACMARTDVTERVLALVPMVALWADDTAATIAGSMPAAAPGEQCKAPHACPFQSTCGKFKRRIDDPECLPSHAGEVGELIAAGVDSIKDMPGSAMTHERNLLVWQSVTSGEPILRPSLAQALRSLPYPRFSLDFEAVAEPIPRFVGSRAHAPLAFQWSCHAQASADAPLQQMGYLETQGSDPREQFVTELLAFCGTNGPILVYSPYEASRLKDLALALPHHRAAIEALIARLVDLLPMMRRGYYAPDMAGSWSIKAILPTIPGGIDYGDLGQSVKDGDAAQAAYLSIIDPATMPAERQRLIDELLVYCPTDTLALFLLVDALTSMPTTGPNVTFPAKEPSRRKARACA